jgi:beta-1,4-N-acetylglucosaminyltransferase
VILVTVGTSGFDQLVEKIDQVAASLDDHVVVQIGYGHYIPKNCQYFRFAPSLEPYYDEANVVVASAGVGTIMEVLWKGKKLISVENTTCIDDHQTDLLNMIAGQEYLVWCRDLSELPVLLMQIHTLDLQPYRRPPCEIGQVIKEFLGHWE